jgi:NAD(P)-dependent dehydrogenase (short-subunit alcohol dehydrogenase family)
VNETENASNVLLLGGTSSLAPQIITKFLDEGYSITATYRNQNECQQNSKNLSWIHLDLNSRESLSEFLLQIAEQDFERIIVLIGATSTMETAEYDMDALYKYYEIYISGLHYLIRRSSNRLKVMGNLVVLSSRSGSHSSFDAHYSATKGALESLVRSIAPKLLESQSAICLAPSLIENSKMFLEMTSANIEKHKNRSNHKLLSIEEVSEFIFALSPSVTQVMNGRTIPLGPDY